jgi:2,3-bisphosphoglycerate-dependent phosphoglycerate mutase
MQLYLIRHGESQNNAVPEAERVEDPCLTPRGHKQAWFLAQWLRTMPIDRVITSPFRRTLETTQPIAAQTAFPIEVWHDVYERGGCYRGHGETACEGGIGLGRREILEHLPCAAVDASIADLGWWNGRPRETDDEVVERGCQVIARLVHRFGETTERVAAVIHAEFKRHLLVQMLAGSAAAERFGAMHNTGITRLTWSDNQWRLDWLNSSSHLPGQWITDAKG